MLARSLLLYPNRTSFRAYRSLIGRVIAWQGAPEVLPGAYGESIPDVPTAQQCSSAEVQCFHVTLHIVDVAQKMEKTGFLPGYRLLTALLLPTLHAFGLSLHMILLNN